MASFLIFPYPFRYLSSIANASADVVVEHYRNLWNFVRVIYEKEDDGNSVCNPTTCPRMSAGA